MAAVALGKNEDAFLLSLRSLYGSVVYIPWPLSQIFVLDGEVMQRVYSTPASTLSFTPFRLSIQHAAFGTSKKLLQSSVWPEQYFPAHAKALATVRLEAPVRQFINMVESKIAELGCAVDAAGGAMEMGLMRWVSDTMFDGIYDLACLINV
jgi:hypothetical protein